LSIPRHTKLTFFQSHASADLHIDVGVIYVQKGIELLVYEFDTGNGQAGWLACLVAVLFALAVYFIEGTGLQPFGRESYLLVLNSYLARQE
jgi:hypothetical protein